MVLLDVNALVALSWDGHVHHAAVQRWFAAHPDTIWSTCSITELGFIRLSSNARILPEHLTPEAARETLAALRADPAHRFLHDDLSPTDLDVPAITGYRQVTDAHLLTLARRAGARLLTFDRGIAALGGADVELLSGL